MCYFSMEFGSLSCKRVHIEDILYTLCRELVSTEVGCTFETCSSIMPVNTDA